MSQRWGATSGDWQHFDLLLGLGADLLPAVSNPQAKISPQSKMKGVGKTPSRYYGAERLVGGIKGWTDIEATPAQLKAWAKEPDYSICLQTRTVRGLDIDIPDLGEAQQVAAVFEYKLGRELAVRERTNSGKKLLAFVLPGDLGKRSFKTAGGLVEFLASGQQFVAAGTHTSGARYEWRGGLPDEFVEITLEQFDEAWNAIREQFAVEPERRSSRRSGALREDAGAGLVASDEVAAWLEANYDSFGVQDGKLFVECPWKDGHSGDSGETEAAWLIAGTGGYAQGHFECLHASCAGRKDEDFLEASGYRTSLFDDLTTAEEKELTAAYLKQAAISSQLLRVAPPGAPRLPLPGFKRNSVGVIEPSLENTVRAVEHAEACGYHVRFDTFRAELMVAEAGTDGWRPFSDADGVEMRMTLERIGFKQVGKELMRDAVELVARDRRFDSAQLWLESRPGWDGVSRAARFMPDYMATDDTPYTRAVGRYAWTAHVARIMDPGCKVDMVPVLTGEQGQLKSWAIAMISPSEDFFTEFNLQDRDTDMSRLMRGTLVGELAELRGLNTRDAESIKAWVTRRHEKWTPKFKEYGTTFPRRLLFWGTSNEDDFLGDPTGERRWLPARCLGQCDVEAVKADRDQLWAEGLALWREHGVLWEEAERLAKGEHEQFRQHDPWEAAVVRWLHEEDIAGSTPAAADFVRVADIMTQALHLDVRSTSKREEMRVGKILRGLGYVRHLMRTGSKPERVWIEARRLVSTKTVTTVAT